MFGWLTRTRIRTRRRPVRSTFSPRRAFLNVEALEERYCLSAPQVTLAVTELANHQVQLTGHVTDDSSPSVTLSFGGVVSGNTTVSSNSDYSYTTTASGLGTVDTVGTDTLNQSSNMAQVNFTSAAPTLTLNYSWGANKTVTLTGKVTSAEPGGLSVTISGSASGNTTTDANGNFSVTLTASQLGQVAAGVTDQWGQASPIATVTLTNAAPQITNFTGVQGIGNVWTFTGHVVDEVPGGMTVTFAGLNAVAGMTVTTNANGDFTLTVVIPAGQTGNVLCETTDMWGVNSNQPSTYVS